jgi:short-subunit dehydrogenase
MKVSAGTSVLLTGASGGLGTYMAAAFADLGVNLALVAYPGADLRLLQEQLEIKGARAITVVCDLRDPGQRRSMIEHVRGAIGRIDVLINNAGVEFTAPYHELTEDQLREIVAVNLEAPMVLTRLVLPEMLQRKQGHIVNISSLAGKSGPAFQEPYAATKAGLVGFTSSLRSTYRGSGVSASVILPGFVEAGIYEHMKSRTGCSAPPLLGTSPPEAVPRAVLRAIERDLPDVIVNPLPVRPLFALSAMFPSLGEWVIEKLGANDFFRKIAPLLREHEKSTATKNDAH